jgi:hypothetical protein
MGDEVAEVAKASQDIRVMSATIRPVCTDLPDSTENPDLLPCDGGFLRSFMEQT